MDGAALAPRTLQILDVLVRAAGDPPAALHESQPSLARRCGVSLATMERAIANLRDVGALAVERSGDGRPAALQLDSRCGEIVRAAHAAGTIVTCAGDARAITVARLLLANERSDARLITAAEQYLDVAREEEVQRILAAAAALTLEQLRAARILDDPLVNKALLMLLLRRRVHAAAVDRTRAALKRPLRATE